MKYPARNHQFDRGFPSYPCLVSPRIVLIMMIDMIMIVKIMIVIIMKVMITIMILNQVPSLLHSYGFPSKNIMGTSGRRARLQSKIISHNSARVPKVKSSLAFQSEKGEGPELPGDSGIEKVNTWESETAKLAAKTM